MKVYSGQIDTLPENGIFVFGSNTQGRHGKGSALIAREKFGAIYGQAKGLHGRSYAIVTKDLTKTHHPSISIGVIQSQIQTLYLFSANNKDLDFYVAYSGSSRVINLNSYSPSELAKAFAHPIIGEYPLFPSNIIFEIEFAKLVLTEKIK